MKIKDRMVLGVTAGLLGNIVKTAIDELSLKHKLSQRSFRSTAAGVWVNSKSQAISPKGQLLGGLFDFGLGALGGIGITHLLSKTGKDHAVIKGILSGITIGSTITAVLSFSPQNTVRPKDAASNLSYMAAHGIYGAVTSVLVTKLADPSLFDVKPLNDYLSPTEPTSLETMEEEKSRKD